jgi:hypothetical protein
MLKLKKGLNTLLPLSKHFSKVKTPKLTEMCDKRGVDLLHDPIFNKGLCYTYSERDRMGIRGLIPPVIRTIEEQEEISLVNYSYVILLTQVRQTTSLHPKGTTREDGHRARHHQEMAGTPRPPGQKRVSLLQIPTT